MYLNKNDAESFQIPGGTKGLLYPSHPKGEQTIAVVSMDGIYPESGYSINERCTETMYITKGEMVVTVDGTEHALGEGDVLMILPWQKYSCRGQADSVDIITPAWDGDQNHLVVNGKCTKHSDCQIKV